MDTGVLIALERGVRRVVATLRVALRIDRPVAISAGALAQAWRGGSRQAVLARLLRSDSVTVVPLDEHRAMAAGMVCAREQGDTKLDPVLTSSSCDLRGVLRARAGRPGV